MKRKKKKKMEWTLSLRRARYTSNLRGLIMQTPRGPRRKKISILQEMCIPALL